MAAKWSSTGVSAGRLAAGCWLLLAATTFGQGGAVDESGYAPPKPAMFSAYQPEPQPASEYGPDCRQAWYRQPAPGACRQECYAPPPTAPEPCEVPGQYPCQPAPCGPPRQPVPRRPQGEIHHVYVQVPEAGGMRERGAGPVPPQRPPGGFAAPPQMGSVVQEQGSVGLSGLRIRFPEWSLQLPSIEFPTLVRRQTGARMELESGVAPYVQGAGYRQYAAGYPYAAGYGVAAAGRGWETGRAPAAGGRERETAQLKESEQEVEQLKRRCEQLERQLRECESLLRQYAQCHPAPGVCPAPDRCRTPAPQGSGLRLRDPPQSTPVPAPRPPVPDREPGRFPR